MRILKTLAASPATSVNEHEFRNLNEVQKFLDELQSRKKMTDLVLKRFMASAQVKASDDEDDEPNVKRMSLTGPRREKEHVDAPSRIHQQVEKIKVGERPVLKKVDQKKIAENFVVIEEYTHQIELLEAIEVRTAAAFKGSPKLSKVLAEIKSRRAEVIKALGEAQAFLHKVASNNLPDEVNNTFRGVVNPIVRQLTERYKAKAQVLHVNSFESNGSPILQFTLYTKLTDLKNDKGFVYKAFFITVNCCIDARGVHHYFVDTGTKYEVPSIQPLNSHTRGFGFSRPKDGMRLLQTHLKADEQLDLLAVDSLPISDKDAKIIGTRVKEYIKSQTIDEEEGTIRFVLIPNLSAQKTDTVVKTILADFGGMLQSNRAFDKIRHKITKTKGGAQAVTLWFAAALPRNGKDYRDNADALHRLKSELGLSDAEVKRISRVLRSRNSDEV